MVKKFNASARIRSRKRPSRPKPGQLNRFRGACDTHSWQIKVIFSVLTDVNRMEALTEPVHWHLSIDGEILSIVIHRIINSNHSNELKNHSNILTCEFLLSIRQFSVPA